MTAPWRDFDPDPLHVPEEEPRPTRPDPGRKEVVAHPSHLGSIVIIAAILVLAVVAAWLLLGGGRP
jgi:hypothetical protein